MDARSKGPLKYPSYVCPFLRNFSLDTLIGIFSFLHEVRVSSNLKSDRTRFYKENLVMGFLCQKSQKWAKNEVFQVLRIISASNLNDFLNEITATLVLKVDLNDFFGEKILF